jgi:hypothetical protein
LQNYYRPRPDRFGDGGRALPGYGTQQTMNNTEPKPATGEVHHVACASSWMQPCDCGSKSATGEWTVEKVILMGVDSYVLSKTIADEHNAALIRISEAHAKEIQQLRAQLAAAQAELRIVWGGKVPDDICMEALDAAIADAQKPLVDALEQVMTAHRNDFRSIAAAALAKAGK